MYVPVIFVATKHEKAMGVEIERKYLVKEGFVPEGQEQISMSQAYLCADPERTVRVRIANSTAYITIKGKITGISRPEFEYEIPVADAKELMQLAIFPPVEKVRHLIYENGKKWEVDLFSGANLGLIIAEVELLSADEVVELPDWIGSEVSNDIRYHNSQLARNPYQSWDK